jgi:hypothetical protein
MESSPDLPARIAVTNLLFNLRMRLRKCEKTKRDQGATVKGGAGTSKVLVVNCISRLVKKS